MSQQAEYEPTLRPEHMTALANALEEGDVSQLVVTAEVVAREWACLKGAILGDFTIRQDGDEWVFINSDGAEVGRIFDVKARPGIRTDG